MNIRMISWVNLDLENLVFEEGEILQHSNLLDIRLTTDLLYVNEDIYGHSSWEHIYLKNADPTGLHEFEIQGPITINVKDLKMQKNFGGQLLYLHKVPKIVIQDGEFTNNSDHNSYNTLVSHLIELDYIRKSAYVDVYPDQLKACQVEQFLCDGAKIVHLENTLLQANN